MKRLFIILLVWALPVISMFGQSTDNIEVDVTKLNSDELRVYQQLKSKMVAEKNNVVTPEKIERYAEIGKAFGSAFKECWGAVSKDAERFAQSPAGRLAMFLVSWKIMSEDVQGLLKSTIRWITAVSIWLVITPVFILFTYRNCITKKRGRILSEEKVGFLRTKISYDRPESPCHGDMTAVYGLCYLVFLGVLALVAFV